MVFGVFVMGVVFTISAGCLFFGSLPDSSTGRTRTEEGTFSLSVLFTTMSGISFIVWGFWFGIETFG